MRDADERFCALLVGLATQIRDAVFGHDELGLVAWGGHDAAWRKEEADLRDASARCGRVDHDDRFAALAHGGAPYEINLSACARCLFVTKRFSSNLPEQIDLNAGIDGDEVLVLRNDRRIVHVFDGVELHEGIVIGPIVELLGSLENSSNVDAVMQRLLCGSDHACFS